jgi:hypothetical protein
MVLATVERGAGGRERGISGRAAGKRRKIRLRTGKPPVVYAACAEAASSRIEKTAPRQKV